MKPISTSNRYARLLFLLAFIVCMILYSPVIEAQQKMYWTDNGTDKIQRANLDGSNVEDLVTTGLSNPRGIALDLINSKMYWTDFGTEKIQRANLDGSNVEDLVTTGLSFPFGIALEVSDITLPVELSIFTAESHIDGVLLRWRTESETNNLGFHIYRSQQKAGEYVRITLALIGGQGNTNTARDYSFVDETAQQGATYWYLIEDVDLSGIRERSDPIELVWGRYGVPLSVIPTQFRLWQNYPNPFNPETWIPYQLATPATLVIKIYDAQGNLVRILDLGQQESGFYHSRERAAYWNGRNDAGEQGSSGIYYYHFQAGDYSATRKMLILK